eukprot:Skav221500  [mRNA]  locus=scaffold2743:56038:61361:- [translate_table: standard]
MVERGLKGEKTFIRYCGFVLTEFFKDNLTAVRDMIYKSWDESPSSPPKQRPETEQALAAPNLQILAWQGGKPYFPSPLTSKFEQGTSEHGEIQKLKETFLQLFPNSSEPEPTVAATAPRQGRASGLCDFSLDNNSQPLDPNRDVDLVMIPDDQFSEERPAADGNADPIPVSFRYEISPMRSFSTHVYKPNPLGQTTETIAANMDDTTVELHPKAGEVVAAKEAAKAAKAKAKPKAAAAKAVKGLKRTNTSEPSPSATASASTGPAVETGSNHEEGSAMKRQKGSGPLKRPAAALRGKYVSKEKSEEIINIGLQALQDGKTVPEAKSICAELTRAATLEHFSQLKEEAADGAAEDGEEEAAEADPEIGAED